MASANYRLCDVCGCKTFYDANLSYEPPTREMIADGQHDYWLHGLGDWAVICVECSETHEVKIVKKEK